MRGPRWEPEGCEALRGARRVERPNISRFFHSLVANVVLKMTPEKLKRALLVGHGLVQTDTPARTPHVHTCSPSTDHTAQMTRVHWLKTSCAPKNVPSHPRVMSRPLLHATLSTSSPSLSSTSDVLLVVFFCEPRLVVHVSNHLLRRSTARWHFHGIPLLHKS